MKTNHVNILPEKYDNQWLRLNSMPLNLIIKNYSNKMNFIENIVFNVHNSEFINRTVDASENEYDTVKNSEHELYNSNQIVEVDCCGAMIPIGFRDVRDYLSELIFKRLEHLKGTFLDFGSGNCFNARYIADRCRNSQIIGIDISASRIDYAQRWLGRRPNIQLIKMNGAHLEFQDDSFDVVYACHALEQMESVIKEAVSEIVRVMKHRAILVEPIIENADLAQKLYILRYGYVKNLLSVLKNLPSIRIVENFPLGIQGSPLNQSSLIVIEKNF